MTRAADGELAADAAAGDLGAYASLYHRHMQGAWRLAHATAPSTDAAANATTTAFVGVVRLVGRGRDDVAEEFRGHLLRAVYRAAHSGSADQTTAAAKSGAPLVDAFTKLPSRWRAAVWLQEVEGLPAAGAGAILGVSGAAAVQLKKRGLAGIEHRVTQAGGSLPLPDLALTLAATVPPLPREVQAKTEAKWKRAVSRDRHLVGAAGVTGGRVARPLAGAAAGLCVLGLIGLAVVSPSHDTSSRLAGPAVAGRPATSGSEAATGAATTTTTVAAAAGTGTGTGASSGATQAPQLIASQPATATTTITTTATTVATTIPPITVAPVIVVTIPTTLPPVTTPPTTAPPTAPTTAPPVPAPAPPALQVSLNLGVLGVNVGLGPNSCTGVNLLGLKVGCTNAPPGLTLGGTLLGGH